MFKVSMSMKVTLFNSDLNDFECTNDVIARNAVDCLKLICTSLIVCDFISDVFELINKEL